MLSRNVGKDYHYSLNKNTERRSSCTWRRRRPEVTLITAAAHKVTLITATAHKVLAEKTEWKRPLRSCSCRQERGAVTGLREMCCDEALWIHPPYGGDQQGTAVNRVGPGVLWKAENVLNSRSNIILCHMELVVGWLVGEENSQSSQCVWTENVFHLA